MIDHAPIANDPTEVGYLHASRNYKIDSCSDGVSLCLNIGSADSWSLPSIPIQLEVVDWYVKTLLSIGIRTYFFAICTRVHTLILQIRIDNYLRQHFTSVKGFVYVCK